MNLIGRLSRLRWRWPYFTEYKLIDAICKIFDIRHCRRIVDTTHTTFPPLVQVLNTPESIFEREKPMKWKMYNKMCNNEGDANEKKREQALKDLLHLDNEEGGH